MIIHLNASDIILAAHVAGMFEGIKRVQVSRGEAANNRIANQGDFAIQFAGMLGEVAISKYIGIPLRTDVTIGGDGNIDMVYEGQTIQVKTSTHAVTPPPRYLIFTKPEDFSTDWAFSCSIQQPAVVKIHGFASKKKFLANLVTHDFGYGTRYCLDEKHLAPIERFHEAIRVMK